MKINASARLLAADGVLKFVDNNRGGSWLEEKRRYIESRPRSSHGVPVMSSETGYFSRPALMPVALLRHVQGMMGEQSRVRQDSLKWLTNHMRSSGRLPPGPRGGDYMPYIMVDYTGKPWMNEGNHRIMSAHKMGAKCLPVQLMYFDGGEAEKNALLRPPVAMHPDFVLACDREAHRLGFTFDNYLTHRNTGDSA